MHLTIVSPFPPAITGIGQYGYHIARALAGSGSFSRITVLAGSPQAAQSPNHLGVTDLEYCWQPGGIGARRAILARIKRLDPDIVWFNLGASVFGRSPWTNLSGLLTPMLTRQAGYPTVVTLHELVELTDLRGLSTPGGPFSYWGARLLTGIATRADVVCLTMQRYADLLTRRGLDCRHIPIGAYHRPDMLEEIGGQELLFFTTLAPFKGLELLLEAFHILRSEYPQLRLSIAGTTHTRFPGYASQLKARFNGTGGTRWLGQVPEDDVKDLFRRAQVVVLPYTASTGSSSVLYQAATWGRSVVASDLAEIRALVQESGLAVEFFRNGDVVSLCSAIGTLLDSPARRAVQAEQNFERINAIQPEETCGQYIRAFNHALRKRDSPVRIRTPGVHAESL